MPPSTSTPSPALAAIILARALAERVEDATMRTVLLDGLDTALAMQNAQKIVGEGRKLVDHWRKMPEHITGSQAIAELASVMSGNTAPGGQGFRPRNV